MSSLWVPIPYYRPLGRCVLAGKLVSTPSSLSYALLPSSGSPCGAVSSSQRTTLVSGLQGGSFECRQKGHVIERPSSQYRPRRDLPLREACVQSAPGILQRSSCLAGGCRASVQLVPLTLGHRMRSGVAG